MNKILARSHSHFQPPKDFFYVFPPLLPIIIFVVVLNAWGSTALAAPAVPQSNGQQFSQQARIGFHAGDDWEPSITADRYGHVYTLYKHYDVSDQQTCFVPSYSYLSAAGFNLPYGDYFSMAVDKDNNTQAAFGEGPNYQGPGNIWVSHSRLIPTFPI